MLAIIGVVVARLSVVGGYLRESGSFTVLMQFVQFIVRGPLPGPLIFSSMRLY
jgi:flagellar motor component MotA